MNSTILSARYIEALDSHRLATQKASRDAVFRLLQQGIEPSPNEIFTELVRHKVLPRGICGALLGDCFLVLNQIGQGGMATVYRVVHIDILRYLAAKLVSETAVLNDPSLADRLQRESLLGSVIVHPSVVRTEYFSRSPYGPFMIMELVDGISLSSFVRLPAPLPTSVVIQCGIEIAGALQLMHSHVPPIIHRDLKPGNLLFSPSRRAFMLSDFGLATTIGASEPLHQKAKEFVKTANAQYLGTQSYSSPEQLRASTNVDHRSDIWSLGATLFALLTGFPPLNTADVLKAQAGIAIQAPSFPRSLAGLPRRVVTTLERMLAPNPSARFLDITDTLASLEACKKCCPSDDHDNWYAQFDTRPSVLEQISWMDSISVE